MDDELESTHPARKSQKIDMLVLGLNLLGEVFHVIGETFESATMLAAMHANYNVEREQFRQDAALQIETIIGEQE